MVQETGVFEAIGMLNPVGPTLVTATSMGVPGSGWMQTALAPSTCCRVYPECWVSVRVTVPAVASPRKVSGKVALPDPGSVVRRPGGSMVTEVEPAAVKVHPPCGVAPTVVPGGAFAGTTIL